MVGASGVRGLNPARRTMFEVITVTRKFPPVGRCIYCGVSGHKERLTTEHIIPYSLYGYMKLPYASCKPCAEITRDFETAVARQMFGPTRLHIGIRTRNRKEQPDRLPIKVKTGDGYQIRLVAIEDHPHLLAMPEFIDRPNLVGFKPLGTTHKARLRARDIQGDLQARVDRLGTGMSARLEFMVVPEFWRLLAKVAHGYVVATRGLNSFEPLLPSFILGREPQKTSDYIGATLVGFVPPDENLMHNLEIEAVWHKQEGRNKPLYERPFLVVSVQLFACFGMPIYDVVVGRGHAPGFQDREPGPLVNADKPPAHDRIGFPKGQLPMAPVLPFWRATAVPKPQ
jgi:hypothetical protein